MYIYKHVQLQKHTVCHKHNYICIVRYVISSFNVHYSQFYHNNPNNMLDVETPLDPCNNNFSTSQPLSLENPGHCIKSQCHPCHRIYRILEFSQITICNCMYPYFYHYIFLSHRRLCEVFLVLYIWVSYPSSEQTDLSLCGTCHDHGYM